MNELVRQTTPCVAVSATGESAAVAGAHRGGLVVLGSLAQAFGGGHCQV
jgi:hypothetical protein